jgi:hypothetical protein
VACQRQQAKLHGLRLFDLFQLVCVSSVIDYIAYCTSLPHQAYAW